ncbi:MAG: hypothetical protein JWP74_4194 [Marmoricola sp.]|nr:hypothetical protein [Marmoricola sp.]
MTDDTEAVNETPGSPGHVLEGGRVAVLDPHAIEEGRLAARKRSRIGTLTESPNDSETNEPVTREIVAVRLAVLEETRAQTLDELAIIQGRIIGLREILASHDDVTPHD